MKKAVNSYLLKGDTKFKLDLIKKVGYDGVLLGVCGEEETISLEEQVLYCKAIGLEISMIHCSYNKTKLNSLWLEGRDGDDFIDDLINQVERIKNMEVKNFIIHTNGTDSAINSLIGLKRIQNLLKVCEKYDINLGIENLLIESQVKYIFDNLKSKHLKFCYDCGHENLLIKNVRYAEEYSKYLTTVHLHDNYGEFDEHRILGEGNINKEMLAKSLSGVDLEFLTLEIRFKEEVEKLEDYLTKGLDALKNLENRINFFRG